MSARPELLEAIPPRGTRVVLGLSGGVDSAVAALRLVDAGCEVTAVTTRNFCFDDPPFDDAAASRSCCSQEAVDASRALRADLGMSHVVVDAFGWVSTLLLQKSIRLSFWWLRLF